MTGLVVTLIFVLLAVILVQFARVSELSKTIRGVEEAEKRGNDRTALWLVVFMVLFLVFCVVSAIYYKDVMLGYGPHKAASAHGGTLDGLFNTTLFFTGIVFIATQILLFWYAFKYRFKSGRKTFFFVHNTNLELVWTGIPAVVMFYLVFQGLIAWNDVMPDVDPTDEYLEIEATGYQFAWDIRYPGPDSQLGKKDVWHIQPGINDLGLHWTDEASHDDIILSGADPIYVPVDTMVRIAINSKDVLHNFYLPHFRVKMDAVPGIPTYFIFTPTMTTQEYRNELKDYPEWDVPVDPTDPESPMRWEAFEYELACAELCGNGHYSMRRIFKVVEREEYDAWIADQKSFYLNNIRGTENDPEELRGKFLKAEIGARSKVLKSDFDSAVKAEKEEDMIVRLEHVFFNTGSAGLDNKSRFELDNLADIMGKYPNVNVELQGHTDNVGDAEANMTLSQSRAESVREYLLSKGVSDTRLSAVGYGQTVPVDTNDTEEGRAKNRRTELKILQQTIN